MCFLLTLMSSLQQNWRRGQAGSAWKWRGWEKWEGAGDGEGGRGEMAQTMYAHMNKWINKQKQNAICDHSFYLIIYFLNQWDRNSYFYFKQGNAGNFFYVCIRLDFHVGLKVMDHNLLCLCLCHMSYFRQNVSLFLPITVQIQSRLPCVYHLRTGPVS
jgi:hypothetical protein